MLAETQVCHRSYIIAARNIAAKMWKINNIKIKIVPFEIYHDVNTIPKIICHSKSVVVRIHCSKKKRTPRPVLN